MTFGKRAGGGRRRTDRTPAMLPALVTTVGESQSAVLTNVSRTGARLRGNDLPCAGQDLMMKVDRIEVFATVVWTRQHLRGIRFEDPLPECEVQHLRREARSANLTRRTPEEQMALDDWNLGLAR